MASRREIRTFKQEKGEGCGKVGSFSVIVKLCGGSFLALVLSVHSVHSWHNNTHLWRLHLQSTQSQEEPPQHPSQVEKVVWCVCWGECEDIVDSEPKEATHISPTENTFTLGPIVPTRSPLPAIAASETLEYLVSFYLCFRDLRDPREYKNSSQGHGDEMWVAVVRTPVILWSD